MKSYFVEGRVLPERLDLNIPTVNFDHGIPAGMGLSYEIDSITDLEQKCTSLFGVEGYVFDNQANFDPTFTFKSALSKGSLPVSLALINNDFLARATFELRNSIRYPDFTALHSRLAIEAIRNHFDEKEDKAWPMLRAALRVKQSTLREFEDIANLQRHGRNKPQTWEQRRRCMQIAWEVTYRFTQLLNSDPSLLDAPEL